MASSSWWAEHTAKFRQANDHVTVLVTQSLYFLFIPFFIYYRYTSGWYHIAYYILCVLLLLPAWLLGIPRSYTSLESARRSSCANIAKEQEGRTISEQALLLRWRTWYRYVCWCVTTIHLQKVRIVRHIYLYTNIPVFCLGYYIRLLPLNPKLELGFLKIDSD